jgi:type I restriction enzyme S subunit
VELKPGYLCPPGYKQTEVGVIPEEWEVRKLPEVSWFQEGPGLRQWQFTSSGMKVINVTNLEGGVLNLERTDRHISISEFMRIYQHFAIDAADIVMASSGNSYGKTAVVREQDLPLVMNTSVIRFKPTKAFDYSFLWALLNSPLFKNQVDLMITGGAQPNFGPYHLKRVNVPVPTPAEQRAIAGALSDLDELIGALDQLVAKKRDLMQAAMQQLLTGKKRLPGFHEKWELKRLRDVAEMRSGGTPPSSVPDYYDGNIPWASISDMTKSGKVILSTDRKLTNAGFANSATQMFPVGTVLYAMYASLGECSIAGISLCSSQAILGIRPKDNLDKEFLYYFLTSLKPAVKTMGQHGTQANLNKGMVQDFQLRLPPLPEQTAIAEVLSDMDAELATLEQRRDKTRALKQGMMQELLTGRIRLVNPEKVHKTC